MIEAEATARNVRTSAQKAGLVCDLIRGEDVNRALATLQFTKKTIARDIAKVLRSAVANAQQKDGFSGDVERLYVAAAYANQGPSLKRVRPAPMGRAFRVVKRSAHLTVRVAERPLKIAVAAPEAEGLPAAPPKKTAASPAPTAPVRARKTTGGAPGSSRSAAKKKTAGAKKKTASRGAKKKTAKR
jgi:large subunit ribosomal protein L22